MKKAFLVFLTLIAFVSCNKSQVEVDFDRPSKTPAGSSAPNPTIVVSNVDVVSNQLVITGTKLDTATSVRVTGPSGFDETFAIESQSDSSLVANSLSNLAIITNGLFDLIISNAYGAATYSISFDLQDGQVTAAKLNDMGASAGDVLTFDGSNWGPAPLTGLTYQGTFDATSVADQTTTGAAAGHYYIVTTGGARDPDGVSNGNTFSIGDWAVYNGATSQWDKVVGTNDVASVAGKTGVVTLSWSDFAKTGSLLSDIANVDVTGRADGDILVWDNAGSEWVVQAPVDTNSNASTLCTGSNVLLGDGSCVALPVDTDTNTNAATICSAGEYLDGDGTCKTAATTTLGVDDITSGAGLYFTYEPDGTGCTAGQVLVWNTINTRWECGNKTVDTDTNTNAGTICSAGEYLDGDGTCKSIPVDTDTTYSAGSGMNLSGTTFSIPAQGVTNTMINGVTANCSSGEVLKANGTGGFSCQADNTGVPSSDATTLRGENLDTNLATDTTTDGQILVWSQTNSQWEVAPAPTDNDTTYAAGTGLNLTTGTFDVDVGTSANKIPQLDGSADLIIDGSYQLSNDLFVRWGSSYITGHGGNNNMRFYTTGTERMRLQGERLGIGNDSPQGILHVSNGGARIKFENDANGATSPAQDMPGLELIQDGNQNAGTQEYGMGIKFMAGDNAFTTEPEKFTAGIFPVATEAYSADTDGGTALHFMTTPNAPGASSIPNTNMILDQDGNLAIGGRVSLRETTAPTNTADFGKVYVKSSDSKLYFMDDAGTEFDLTIGSGLTSSQWTTTGSDIYYNTGNVGINTATPASELHVNGQVIIDDTSTSYGFPNIAIGADEAVGIERDGTNLNFISNSVRSISMVPSPGAVDPLFIRNQVGNIRIHSGNLTNGGISLESAGTSAINFATNANSGSPSQAKVLHTASSVNQLTLTGAATGNSVQIGSDGSDANVGVSIMPKGTGNVGIGITNPTQKLTVDGGINVTTGNDICIDGSGCLSSAVSGGGETNTGSNVGTGAGVFKDKSATTLRFRRIASSGSSLTVTENTDDINLEVNSVGVDKITNGSGLYFTYEPNDTACTDGQVLKWITANTRWECADDTDTDTTYTAGNGIDSTALTGSSQIAVDLTAGTALSFNGVSGALESEWLLNSGDLYTTGNVGIGSGVSTPQWFDKSDSHLLHIKAANNNSVELNLDATGSSLSNESMINFVNNGTRVGYIKSQKSATSAVDGSLTFATHDGTSLENNMILSKEGRLGIGTTDPTGLLTIQGVNEDIHHYSHTGLASGAPDLKFYRSRGSAGSPGTSQDEDWLGSVRASGYDGDEYRLSAGMYIIADGAVSNNTVPSRFEFHTHSSTADDSREVMRIDSAGDVTMEGHLLLREVAAPTQTANYGKVYVKTDNKLYFMDEAGTEHDLLNPSGATVTGIATSADATAITIDSSERVGIGTGTPSESLEVVGSIKATAGTVWSSNGSTGTSRGLLVENYDDTANQNGVDIAAKLGGSEFQGIAWTQDTAWTTASDAADKDASMSFGVLKDNVATTAMTLSSDGFVGIGTNSPSALLDVYDDSSGVGHSMVVTKSRSGNAIYNTLLLRRESGGTPGPGFGNGLSFSLGRNTSSTTEAGAISVLWENIPTLSENRDTSMIFETTTDGSASEKMRITSAGNVGIGTTTPGSNLSVYDDDADAFISVQSESGYSAFISEGNSNTNWQGGLYISRRARGTISSRSIPILDDAVMSLTSEVWDGDSYENAGGIQTRVDGAVSDGVTPLRIDFFTRNTAGAYNQKMTIKNNGHVGIGTTSPLYQLDILDTEIPLRIIRDSSPGDRVSTVAYLISSNSAGPGEDGIGTRINLSAETETEGVFEVAGYFEAEFTDATAGSIDSDIYLTPRSNSSNTANAFVLKSSGNLGLGTNNAEVPLEVQNDDGRIRVEHQGTGTAAFSNSMQGLELVTAGMNASTSVYGSAVKFMSDDTDFTTESPKFLAGIIPRATEAYASDSDGGMALDFATTPNDPGTTSLPTTRMTITQDGNVGIGTSSPIDDFHVLNDSQSARVILETPDGIGNSYNQITMRSDGTDKWLIGHYGDTNASASVRNDFYIWQQTDQNDVSVNTPRFVIDDNGNVGIGTNSPTANLAVSSGSGSNKGIHVLSATDSNNPRVKLRTSNANDHGMLELFDDTETVQVSLRSSADSFINGGNLGIGTTSPTANLSVNGSANKTGGGSWAVFSDARLKDINGKYVRSLEAIRDLEVIRYNYKKGNEAGIEDTDSEFIGFVAQDVQKVIPEAVSETSIGFLEVNNDPILWTMFNSIKELDKMFGEEHAERMAMLDSIQTLERQVKENSRAIASLEEKVEELESENKDLKEQNAKLEERLRKVEKALGL